MNMPISSHQVNNVLRVYGDQLCQLKTSKQPEATGSKEPGRISISAKTGRRTISNDIASNIIDKIIQSGPHDNVEKKAFKRPESEHEKLLGINENHHNLLIFKKIDGNVETFNSLSIEDSKFLTNKLMVITKETVTRNMR
jgi:hypothetical protein